MYSFMAGAAHRLKATSLPEPSVVDIQPIQHTVNNSLKETARIKGNDEYQWFKFKGSKPITLQFRGKPVEISKGMKFGVRPSSSGKDIRLVMDGDLTRVLTLTLDQAKSLARYV